MKPAPVRWSGASARRRFPADRSRSGPARGGHHHVRPAVHPGRRRDRQDTGHLAAGRICACDRRRAPARRPRRYVYRQGGRGDAGAAGRTGSTGRDRRHIPCCGPPPAPPFLAARPRRRIRRRSSSRRCRSSRRWRPGCPAATATSAVRDLAAEIEWAKARRIDPASYVVRAAAEDRDASLPPDLMAGLFQTVRDRQDARRTDRLRGHARADDRADRDGPGDRRGDPRPLSLVLGRRVPGHEPAPGGAARRVAAVVATTSPSSATRTRRSTRSPVRRATT